MQDPKPSSLLWMPKHYGGDLDIYLEPGFAHEMSSAIRPENAAERMNELGFDLSTRLKYPTKFPYAFHEDTALLTQIYLGQNGVSLDIEPDDLATCLADQNAVELVRYSSHNVTTIRQTFTIQMLFSKWVDHKHN